MPKDLTERIPERYTQAKISADIAARICAEQFEAITAQEESAKIHHPTDLYHRWHWFRAGFIAGRAQLESIVAEKIVFSSVR